MLNAMIIAALAASPAASVPYADCLLGNIQPGLSDRAVQLVQQACAASSRIGVVDRGLDAPEAGIRRRVDPQPDGQGLAGLLAARTRLADWRQLAQQAQPILVLTGEL